MNPDPGGLTITLHDSTTEVTMTGGGSWTIPVGPVALVDAELERAVRPSPAQLTNALGVTTDHFDDIILDTPIVASTPSITFTGRHAVQFAQVELGESDLPGDYTLHRKDAEDVFRTLVAEPISDRLANPALDPEHVESIIGTCCVILAIIRRLDLQHASVSADPSEHPDAD